MTHKIIHAFTKNIIAHKNVRNGVDIVMTEKSLDRQSNLMSKFKKEVEYINMYENDNIR